MSDDHKGVPFRESEENFPSTAESAIMIVILVLLSVALAFAGV